MAGLLPRLSRRSSALAANALLGLLALCLALAAPGEGAPKLELASANGSLSLANSREGAAVFHAAGMRPGEEASGSITLTNTGTVKAALLVAPDAAADSPGQGGGRLSDRLELLVIDVTAVSAPITVYDGTLEQMRLTDVGSLAPGAKRTFLFVASLPPGPGDNAFQGAALSTGFRWSATGAASTSTPAPSPTAAPTASPTAAPTASPTAAPTASPTAAPASPAGGTARTGAASPPSPTLPGRDPSAADPTGEVLGAQLFALPAAKGCVSRRRFTIHVRRPQGIVYASIAVTVDGRTRVRLKGLKARSVKAAVSLAGLPAGTVTVRITGVTTTGRKAVSKRTYRTCAARRG